MSQLQIEDATAPILLGNKPYDGKYLGRLYRPIFQEEHQLDRRDSRARVQEMLKYHLKRSSEEVMCIDPFEREYKTPPYC